MADNELKINIELNTTGQPEVKAAGESLKKLSIDTSDLGDETKRSLGLMPDLEKGIKEGGKAAEEAGLSHRELRKVLFDVGNTVAPQAGHALSELAFGPVGAALALVSAFELLRDKIGDAEKAEDDLLDDMAQPDTSGIDGVRTAWDDAAKAFGDYLTALSNAGKDNDEVKTQVDRAKQIVEAQLTGQMEIQKALQETEILRMRAEGASPDQIAAAGARDQVARDLIQNSLDKIKGSSGLLLEQDLREKQQPALEADAKAKSDAARAADQKFLDDQAKLQKDQALTDPNSKAGKALQAKITEAASALQDATASPDETISYAGGPAVDRRAEKAKAIAEAQAELNAANQQLANVKKEADDLQKSLADREATKAEADEAAKTAAKQATENQGRLRQLPGEIDQAGKVEGIEEHTRRVTEILNSHGGKLNESLGQLASETGKTHDQILNIVAAVVEGQITLKRLFAELEGQLNGSRNYQGGQG